MSKLFITACMCVCAYLGQSAVNQRSPHERFTYSTVSVTCAFVCVDAVELRLLS